LNFSKLVAIATGTSENLIPLYCAVFYSSALFVHVYGGTVFWRVNTLIALVSVLIILIFILGSAPYADFHQNASLTVAPGGYREEGGEGIDNGWFIGGVPMFLRAFPVSAWFFVGVESLNFACVFVEKVSRGIRQA
jgi:amino acid transporter